MLKITSIASATITTLLFTVGCQSSGPAHRSGYRSPSDAVVCDQCKTTWVRSMAVNEKGVPLPWAYTMKKATVCPECARAAEGYFDTGKLEPCKSCGGSMEIVAANKPLP